MKSSPVIWHNGKFVSLKDAKISILSHALHYGTGVFEGMRAYETPRGTAIFRLKEHVDRLFFSASQFGVPLPYTKKEIAQAIKKTVLINKLTECYIRPIIFFGEGPLGLSPQPTKLHVAIAAWPWGAYLGEHKELSIGVSKYIRFHPKSIVPGTKINGYYAMSALVTLDAKARGFDECILLDHEGLIAEGPGENIFIVKRGILFTPKSLSILPGITRDSIMSLAKDMGITVREKKMSIKELADADEAFFTGTAAEVAIIQKFNRKKIGNHAKTEKIGPTIREAYIKAVHGKIPRYRRWLSLV